MKKALIFFVMICLLLGLIGCAVNITDTSDGTFDTESPTEEKETSANKAISITTEITELESGFSAVRYDGDDALELFLEQGGAASDHEVLQFLALLHGGAGLQFGGNAFGCSTISVENACGGYLFGRNFDWQTCDALVVAAYPKEGYASISTVNLGFIRQGAGIAANDLTDEMLTMAAVYAPLDGMNEKGLCVSVNMIQDNATIQQETGKPDLTTTTAVRLLLDRAATVDEALELLGQYDLHASMNYMVHFAIADNEGKRRSRP